MRRSEAIQRRRELNIRIDKRRELPCGKRVQPQADEHRATTTWGKLLELRNGWHGVQTDSGRRMFYVMHLVRRTYVINIEPYRQTGGPWPYHIKANFLLTDSMMTLVSFEQMMQLEHVRNVFEFHVEADPGPAPATGGVRLKPVLCTILTTPVKYDKMASSTDDAYRRVRDTGPIAQIT